MPFPSPGDLLPPGNQLGSLALQEDSIPAEPPGKPFILITLQNITKKLLMIANHKLRTRVSTLVQNATGLGYRQLIPKSFGVVSTIKRFPMEIFPDILFIIENIILLFLKWGWA